MCMAVHRFGARLIPDPLAPVPHRTYPSAPHGPGGFAVRLLPIPTYTHPVVELYLFGVLDYTGGRNF
jgi:hypothetical protein